MEEKIKPCGMDIETDSQTALLCSQYCCLWKRHVHATDVSTSFSFSSRWHRNARKGPYALRSVSQQSPQGCPRNSVNICLVAHRSFSTLEGGMSAASFLRSSFLQAINAVMLWPVHVEKVPQASEHLCPAKLQTRCDICCALPATVSTTSF